MFGKGLREMGIGMSIQGGIKRDGVCMVMYDDEERTGMEGVLEWMKLGPIRIHE